MRAQNEPPEPSFGSCAGQSPAGPTDIPDASSSTGSTSRRSPRGGSGRRAAAPSLRASPSAPRRASEFSISAPPPAARRPSSRGGRRRRAERRPGARARGERRPARSDERHGRLRRWPRAPAGARGFDRASSTRRARVSARSRRGPTSAGAPSRCPSYSSRSCARRPSVSGPAARPYAVCTINAAENEASSTRSGSPSTTSAPSGPRSATRDARSSCSRSRTGTGRPGFFVARLRCRKIAAGDAGPTGSGRRGRALDLRGGLLAPRRAARGAARSRRADLPLRRRRRALHPAITIGPVVLRSISPLVHERGRRARLPPHGRRAEQHFDAIKAAGGDSVTFHVEAVDDARRAIAARPRARARRRRRVQPRDRRSSARAAAAEGADLASA